jgi:general secretion pathway protein F
VLTFFLMFVLPQFGAVLHDFGAKIDPVAGTFLQLSEFMIAQKGVIATTIAILLAVGLLLIRQAKVRAAVIARLVRLPVVRTIVRLHLTAKFCRNLEVLLSAGVPLTTSLRILADMMATWGDGAGWTRIVERVRQGGKLSESLEESGSLPVMAVVMLRLGEETGQLPVLAGRVAKFMK